jgi:hypothetical protein
MKLSIEAKVAAAVAAGFVALTVGEMAQGNSAPQSASLSAYGPSQYGYGSSLGDRTDVKEHPDRTHWQLPESL